MEISSLGNPLFKKNVAKLLFFQRNPRITPDTGALLNYQTAYRVGSAKLASSNPRFLKRQESQTPQASPCTFA